MKVLVLLLMFFSFHSLAKDKMCYKGHRVTKTDSLYSLHKNYLFKKHFSYKKFLSLVKKENGMSKGSDILRMRNKIISLPYICQEKKAVTNKPFIRVRKDVKKITIKNKEKFDLYGLEADSQNIIQKNIKSYKKTKEIKNLTFTLKSKTETYKTNKNNSTTGLTPIALGLEYKNNIYENIYNYNEVSTNRVIYSNNLDKTLQSTNFRASSMLGTYISNFILKAGVNLEDRVFVNFDEQSLTNEKFLASRIKFGYSFNILSSNFIIQAQTLNKLISGSNLAGFTSNDISLDYLINNSYSISMTTNYTSTKRLRERISESGIGVGFNYLF